MSQTLKYQNSSMAEYFHFLVNIEDYPDFLTLAKELALEFFSKADYSNPNLAFFDYSRKAFDERMDKIYNEYTATMYDLYWLDAEEFSTEAVIESLRQQAPMNLIDGAWLQNILKAGPCNDVQARLFRIWCDEAGNGKIELNHCNIYEALLRSVNIYTPAITSRHFIEMDLLPTAWSNPVFQLSVGLFPQNFFPELLGMTLYLEWEATPTLTPIVRMLEHRRINAQYYRLHVAIDNVASGHGALAKEAIKLYLDEILENGGDYALQHHWKRIWNGYVTWATEGTFGKDLYEYLRHFDGKNNDEEKKKYAEMKMISLIRHKAPYARKAHGGQMLGKGANRKPLNELFDEPQALMQALIEDPNGWVNLKNPRDSRFFKELLNLSGPMYKIFDENDQAVVLDWLETQHISSPVTQMLPAEDIGQKMKEVVERYAPQASTEPAHRDFVLPDIAGHLRTVQEWFQQTPEILLEALANSEYIVKGSAATSRFFTEVLVRGDLMGRVGFSPAEVAIMKSWVDKRCPQPGQIEEKIHLTLEQVKTVTEAAAEGNLAAIEVERKVPFAQKRLLIGAGSVH